MFVLILFRYIIRPVKLLDLSAKKISEGDFKARVSLQERHDEFGSLAESFNKMADAVDKNMQQLAGEIESAQETKKKTDYLTVKDELTDLYNQAFMQERIKEEIKKASVKNSTSALFIIDIDGYDEIKKIYGHKSVDIILLETAKIISRNCAETDIVSHFHSDKFVILSPDCSAEYAEGLSEKIRNKIESNRVITPDGTFAVTASIGVSFSRSRDGKALESENDFIHSAEAALQQAKKKGKNKVEILS